MRDLEDREYDARMALIRAYLSVPAGELAQAVIESEAFKAIAELRRVNELLREHGFQGPLGARGVEDVFTAMGKAQLHQDEVQLTLEMAEAAVSLGGQFSDQAYQDVLGMLRSAASRKDGDDH